MFGRAFAPKQHAPGKGGKDGSPRSSLSHSQAEAAYLKVGHVGGGGGESFGGLLG